MSEFSNETMRIVHAEWADQPSFKLIPIEGFCNFVEVVYDPASKVLAVVGNQIKRKLQLVGRLDENGDLIKRKVNRNSPASSNEHQMQRIEVDAYYEYYLENASDIAAFVRSQAVNPEHEAFLRYFPRVATLNDESQVQDASTTTAGAGIQPKYQTAVTGTGLGTDTAEEGLPESQAGTVVIAALSAEGETLTDEEAFRIAQRD